MLLTQGGDRRGIGGGWSSELLGELLRAPDQWESGRDRRVDASCPTEPNASTTRGDDIGVMGNALSRALEAQVSQRLDLNDS